MEAYTNFANTILYYAYDCLPFNFEFIINVTAQSTAAFFKEEIDLWINNVPQGGIFNWVVRISLLMQKSLMFSKLLHFFFWYSSSFSVRSNCSGRKKYRFYNYYLRNKCAPFTCALYLQIFFSIQDNARKNYFTRMKYIRFRNC